MKLSAECHYVQFVTLTLFAFSLSGFDSESNRCESGSTPCLGPHTAQDTMWDLPESCRPHLWQIQDGPHGFYYARTGQNYPSLISIPVGMHAKNSIYIGCTYKNYVIAKWSISSKLYDSSYMYHHFWYHHLLGVCHSTLKIFQAKTIIQGEIDTACELGDFYTHNVQFAMVRIIDNR